MLTSLNFSFRCATLSLFLVFAFFTAVNAQVDTIPNANNEWKPGNVEPLDSAYLAEIDSIIQEFEARKRIEQVEKVVKQNEQLRLKKEMSFTLKGALPLARGLILTWRDHDFINHPSVFEQKSDRYTWTDYAVGGLPLAANWVMKAAGVKSRSKLERMLTANALAFGISFGATESLKLAVRETRPDRTDDHSFPSGHTNVAFVSASILSREYGYLSPWITIGGYATATATQVLRVKHNRHWMNDLHMGAAIGMVSTNFAYFLTDRIFGEKAINTPEVRHKDILRLMRFNAQPTGLSFLSGTEIGNQEIRFDNATVKTGAAISAGFDLSIYTSPYFAVELMTRLVDAQMKVFNTEQTFMGDQLDIYHFDLSAKFSTPVDLSRRFGSRVFAGTRILGGATLTDGQTAYTIPKETKFELGLGINYYCLDTDNYAWGLTCDYFHTFSHYLPNRYSISSVWKIIF